VIIFHRWGVILLRLVPVLAETSVSQSPNEVLEIPDAAGDGTPYDIQLCPPCPSLDYPDEWPKEAPCWKPAILPVGTPGMTALSMPRLVYHIDDEAATALMQQYDEPPP
jgi:hypothetical protein